ncbi:hypothetical protein AB5I41_06075 [Sphingomonas sp. MMS24-JH45]
MVRRRLRPRPGAGGAALTVLRARFALHPPQPRHAAEPRRGQFTGSAVIWSAARRCRPRSASCWGNSIDADTGAALAPETVGRLAGGIAASGAAPAASLRRTDLVPIARTALEARDGGWQSVAALNAHAQRIGGGSRDRL